MLRLLCITPHAPNLFADCRRRRGVGRGREGQKDPLLLVLQFSGGHQRPVRAMSARLLPGVRVHDGNLLDVRANWTGSAWLGLALQPPLVCPHTNLPRCALHSPRRCSSQLTKIELLPAGAPLFVSPATLQGYRTEADFGKHMQTVAERLGSSSR